MELRVLRCAEVGADVHAALRALVDDAFGSELTEEDWQHAHGGWHVVLGLLDRPLAHAAVVPREMHVDGVPILAGYLEAVATSPGHRGLGLGSVVLGEVDRLLRRHVEMGALSTGAHRFYERAGWERWRGRTYVRSPAGDVRTPDDDDGLMVLRYGRSAAVDLTAPMSCEPRSGDAW